MKQPKKYGQYKCPMGKSEPKVPSRITYDKGSKSNVSGRYCKNNCSEYRNNTCPLFKRK